jgi:membrane-bound serine protease (ClpP class)
LQERDDAYLGTDVILARIGHRSNHLKWRGLGVLLAMLLLFAVLPAGAQGEEYLLLEVEGPVTPAMATYFERGIEEAQSGGARAVVIRLDTPGGAVDVTQDIVQVFRNAAVPVIVYVSPAGAQAASAGSIITAAAHASAMAPETVIGAAAPVDSTGADIGETLLQKLTEDLKATMRNLTERRGEEAIELAEAMIEEARAVTAVEALDAGLIDAVAEDVPDLIKQLDGLPVIVDDEEATLELSGATERSFPMNGVEQLLHALSNPLLIGILMTIGVQAILIEISNPGGWVAGFIGVLCLGMALYGLGTLPANWLGLGLIVVAFVLLAFEVTTPSTGALGVVGALTFLAGLLVLFNSPGTPEFARISIAGAAGITVFATAFFLFLVTKAMRAQRVEPRTGAESMIGQVGPVKVDLKPASGEAGTFDGSVLVNGEIWRATSDEAILSGERVVVKAVDGFTLRVKRV